MNAIAATTTELITDALNDNNETAVSKRNGTKFLSRMLSRGL